MSTPAVSVVIPAYNEAERLPQTLRKVRDYLERERTPYEIVVVDDGSSDDTVALAQQAGGPCLVLLRNDGNRGKGYSVRRGMLGARAARRLMTDADLSTPIEELAQLMRVMDQGFDVVIASRALAGARIEVRQPAFREAMGRVFNRLVQLLAIPGIHDTQCGFKLFRAEAAQAAFSACRLDGFSFDVEALFVARKRGMRVAEVPVTWRNDAATHVGLLKGALAFLDLARIRLNDWIGRYGDGGPPPSL